MDRSLSARSCAIEKLPVFGSHSIAMLTNSFGGGGDPLPINACCGIACNSIELLEAIKRHPIVFALGSSWKHQTERVPRVTHTRLHQFLVNGRVVLTLGSQIIAQMPRFRLVKQNLRVLATQQIRTGCSKY